MEHEDVRKQKPAIKDNKQKSQAKKKYTRRGYGKKNNKKNKKGTRNVKFSVLGSNANGIFAKQESLKTLINKFLPKVITVQESKVKQKGLIKIKGYQIFEKVRVGMQGGGLLTAVDHDLQPVLVTSNEEEEAEILTVQIKVGDKLIRIINAYGPQEDESQQKIFSFWTEVENEVIKARDNGCLILIQTDANAKVGNTEIKNDPHETSNNGKILLEMVRRQNLTIGNSLDKCKGLITRERKTVEKTEKSVIDFIILCEDLKEYLEQIVIDDGRVHALTKYGKNGKITVSDHNVMLGIFNLSFNRSAVKPRTEFFNFKDKDNQEAFFEETNETTKLSSSFIHGENFAHKSQIFYKNLNNTFFKCFDKIRITTGIKSKYGDKTLQGFLKLRMELKQYLLNCDCLIGKKMAEEKLKETETILTKKYASKSAEIIKEKVSEMKLADGVFSQVGFWKIRQKFCPQARDPPMAKKDENGLLITSPNLLKDLYLRTYKHRLRQRDIKPELMDILFLKTELWESRLDELLLKKSSPWSSDDLDKVLKSLKNNKTRDPVGMINEIFKPGCAGKDLKLALLHLFNGIKANQFIPEYMNLSNITTIFKNSKSKLNMDSERGIFILTSLKRILDKLLYFDNFGDIDKNMSDSNIGARRNRSIKDHLFMIYGIINSVVRGKEDCVDIQIYDIEKAFDALWLIDCLNDVYDSLPLSKRNDKLALLFEANKRNMVAVNTAVGMTERINIPDIVQQGGTWGPGLCSNSVDTLGKKCRDRDENIYYYKKKSKVLIFAMCDDLNGVAKCGLESVALNSFITTQIELKRLRFHVPDKNGKSKCHKIHVGRNHDSCPVLKVHDTVMEAVTHDTYLGDIVSADGRNTLNVKKRIGKGLGIITQIVNLLEFVSLGEFFFEIFILLRESIFINGILTNSEIWYSITREEIKEMENLDMTLMRKIFKVPYSTPSEAYYLELGILSLETIIKKRRIMYYHYLVTRNEEEMLHSFFITQLYDPSPGDWTEQAKQDYEDLQISSEFEYLKGKSQESFKRIVKRKAEIYELLRLTKKQEQHSKMENLHYSELKIQDYLCMPGISTEVAQNLFRWRVRMASFGENFRGNQGNVVCPLCHNHLDNQSMAMQCDKLKNEMEIKCTNEDVFKDKITLDKANNLFKLNETRIKLVKEVE